MVGCGAIGRGVMDALSGDDDVAVTQVIASARSVDRARETFAGVAVATDIGELPARPGLLVECAGHGAVVEHVLPALARGIDCIVCSIGALAADGLAGKLEAAARDGRAQAVLIPGAIGGMDAIAAARVGGLEEVVYTGRKPPQAWQGTPAADRLDLAAVAEATEIFAGSARMAAHDFPKNANVAATTALAGLGLDATRVRLIADPGVQRNQHQVSARGAFGELTLQLANLTLPTNAKTSALTVYSAVRAVRNRAAPVVM